MQSANVQPLCKNICPRTCPHSVVCWVIGTPHLSPALPATETTQCERRHDECQSILSGVVHSTTALKRGWQIQPKQTHRNDDHIHYTHTWWISIAKMVSTMLMHTVHATWNVIDSVHAWVIMLFDMRICACGSAALSHIHQWISDNRPTSLTA